ncbi:hypothetical protein [Sporosarcina koreensis]|uniref:hypothetical protein n=1 Tax=Sporosarcina koreensis TaxID=334735 RepID=UPI00058E575D|nr:hypothetical protein [Sporosarcina koreensis]
MASRWIKLASLYFITGIGLGLFMSATIQLKWAAAHAHVNLVGWLSAAVIGLVYATYPRAGRSVLGTWTFWLYQIGLPFLLASMFMVQIPSTRGFAHVITFSGGGALALGIVLFIVNVFMNVHDEDLRHT